MSPLPSDNTKSSLPDAKKTLRKIARTNLESLTIDDRKRDSALLVQKLAVYLTERFVNARRIATFSSLSHEPDLSHLSTLLPEKQFYYPLVLSEEEMSFHLVTNPSTLKRGSFGILEPNPQVHPPVQVDDLDLILVPALAYDLRGNRLGHGKGYYDRFLKEIPTTPTIGIGYGSQLLHDIPSEPHDHPMAFLANERGVIPA